MGLAETALRMVTKYGEPVVLSYETGETVDPATGIVSVPATTVSHDGFGYPGEYKNDEIDGSVVKRGDIKLTLNAIAERPGDSWKCNVDGQVFRVMMVKPIKVSGVDAMYICQLRK